MLRARHLRAALVAGVCLSLTGGIVSGTYSLESDGSGWSSYGLRCEVPYRHVLMFSTWEHMTFDDLSGTGTSGDRVSLGALWRFNR